MVSLDAKEKTSERAYFIWEAQGRPHGRDLEHWLQAEAELTAKPERRKKAAGARAAARADAGTPAAQEKAPATKPKAPAAQEKAPAAKPKAPAAQEKAAKGKATKGKATKAKAAKAKKKAQKAGGSGSRQKKKST